MEDRSLASRNDATATETPSAFRRGLPFLLLAGLALIFFADLVVHPGQVLYSDHSDYLALHLPSTRFWVSSWRETGELPLWCPYSFSGRPFCHDGFYPFHWPLFFLPESWFPEERFGAAFSWLIVFHVIIAGWCMFAYARAQGLGGPAALTAALGYMFAGKWLLHLLAAGHYLPGLAWLPMVLLWQERAIRQRSLRSGFVAGCFYALVVLGTHPQWAFYSGLFLALWTLCGVASGEWRVASEETGNTAARRNGDSTGDPSSLATRHSPLATLSVWLGFNLWTALLGAGLSAVQLFPIWTSAAESSRSGGVAAADLLMLGKQTLHSLVGPALIDSPPSQIWEERGGLGLLWVAAAIMAPVLCPTRRVKFQAAVCLFLFLFSLGGALVLQWLPIFGMFRQPARMLLVATLPIAYLAGVSMQALGAGASVEARRRCRQILGLVVACVALLVGSWAVELLRGDKAHPDGYPVHGHVYWYSLLLTVPIAFGLLGRGGSDAETRRRGNAEKENDAETRRRGDAEKENDAETRRRGDAEKENDAETRRRGDAEKEIASFAASPRLRVSASFSFAASPRRRVAASLCWIVVLLIDLWVLVWPWREVRPEAEVYASSACVRFLQDKEGRVLDRDQALETGGENQEEIQDLSSPLGRGAPLALLLKIEPVRGYSPIDILRYKEYLQFVADVDEPLVPLRDPFGLTHPVIRDFPLKNQPLLDLLGTRWLLQPSDQPPPKGNWRQVVEDPSPRTYDFYEGGVRRLKPYTIYENRDAFPRAFFVPEAEPLPERSQVLAKLKATDFRRVVLLEGRGARGEGRGGEGEKGRKGEGEREIRASRERERPEEDDRQRPVTLVQYQPNRVVLQVEKGPAGYLVLTDVWFPGWQCTVNGRPVEVYRANYIFRAVEVPADACEVVFALPPTPYYKGIVVGGTIIIVLGLLATILPWRAFRRQQREEFLTRVESRLTEMENRD